MNVMELPTEQIFIVIKDNADITDIGDIRIKAFPYIIITIIPNPRELQSFSKTFSIHISDHIQIRLSDGTIWSGSITKVSLYFFSTVFFK
jgi:hypothetical protein